MGSSTSKKSSNAKPSAPNNKNLLIPQNPFFLHPSTSRDLFSQSSIIRNSEPQVPNTSSNDSALYDCQNLIKKRILLVDNHSLENKELIDQHSKETMNSLKISRITTAIDNTALGEPHGQEKKETKDFYHPNKTKSAKSNQSTINTATTSKISQNSNLNKETSQTQQLKPMHIEDLAKIMNTHGPRVMTFILNNHSNGFIDLLKTNDMPFESLKLIVEAIQICSECSECPFTRSAFLQTILYCDIFHTSLPQWLNQIDVDSLNIVFNILSICNKLMLEFPKESARKLKKTLLSARRGLQRINRKDTITISCLEMIENLLKSSHEISSSSENLLDMSRTGSYFPDTETSNICSVCTTIIEKEMNDIIKNQTENDYDYTKMQVIIVGIECDLSNGVQHVLEIIEIETIKGRVLLPGSIIALHPQEESQTNHYLKAVVTAVQLECGTILVKFNDLNLILDSTTRFTLIEGPILYKVEYISLLEALYLTQKSEIGFLEQFKPTDSNIPSEKKTSVQIDNALTNFDDNGVKAVITCPGEKGVTFGISYISKKLSEKPMKPILVLCKTDDYLNTFVQELIPKNQNIICDAGTGTIKLNNLIKWTLNSQQNYFKKNFACQIRKQILDKMNRLKQEIINEFKTLNANCQTILSADHLIQFMNQEQKQYFDVGNTFNNWLKPSPKNMPPFHVCGQNNIKYETKYIFSQVVDEQLIQFELNRRPSECDNSQLTHSKHYSLKSQNKIDDLQFSRNLQFLAEPKVANINQQLQQSNPLNLSDDERWQLYKFWLQLYKQTKMDRLQALCAKYEKMYKQLEEIICEIKLLSMTCSKVEVIIMTTVAAIKQHQLLKLFAADTVLVMEASNVPVVHILPFIYKNCQSLIVVGSSLIHQPQISGGKILDSTGFQQLPSILEQVLTRQVNAYVIPCATYMHPFTHKYFMTMDWLPCSTNSIAIRKIIKGTTWNIAILDHNQPDLLTENNYINLYEQKFIIGLCKVLINKGTPAANITIVTLTTDQWISTTNLISKLELNIKCEMIVNVKNEKNDIIVLSASPLNDHIYNKHYISQLLSMANVGFIFVAKFKILDFKKNNNMWEKLMLCAKEMGIVGKTGAIVCQDEHKLEELTINTNNINKIAKIIAGGCKKSLTIMLSCGHNYLQKCNSVQNQNIVCKEKCLKIICKKHNTICENSCGAICSTCVNHKCKKMLPCGHICSKMANESCEFNCAALIDYGSSPCGHQFQIRCFEKSKSSMYLSMKCEAKCDTIKPCGHKCEGNCGKCFGGKMHTFCAQKCQRTLVCGHICNNQCEIDCPPCNKIMSHTCIHKGKRDYLCGTLIPVCIEKCCNTCPHFSCSKQCWEPCDYFPCKEPCQKLLPCGHQCIGLCNDACPKFCLKCHPSVFKKNQHLTSNQYVYLEDCGHLVDVNMMDNIMKQNHTFYSCPICKMLIESNQRYKNTLIQQQCNLFSIRSTYERGGQAHLLADLTIDEQLPNETSLIEAPNKKFDLARQQIILELFNCNNVVHKKVLIGKIVYYNTLVNLYQTSIHSPGAAKTDNLKLIKDYINKLLVMHRVLNSISSQRQLNDFHCELQRTTILAHVLGLELTINSPSHVITCFILKQLLDQKPFNDEIMAKIISCMKDVDRMINDITPFQSIICSLPSLPQLLSMNNKKWEQCTLKFWHFKSYGKCTVCLPE